MREPTKLKNDTDKVCHQFFLPLLLVPEQQMPMAFL